MNRIFCITIIFVFLTLFVEYITLILQLKGKRLTKWWGENAFNVHMTITVILWVITFCLIVLLQFVRHPVFHSSIILKYLGPILLVSGLFLALWAFRLLGLKRSFSLNFFEENVPIVKKSLYKYIKNPEYYGLWMALIGLAVFTGSIYNLIVALEFIVILIPHIMLENKVLK